MKYQVITFVFVLALGYVKSGTIMDKMIPGVFELYYKNSTAVQRQLECVIYDGPCDILGTFLKARACVFLTPSCESHSSEMTAETCLPYVIQMKIEKILERIHNDYPDDFKELVKKYLVGDPEKGTIPICVPEEKERELELRF